MLSEHVQRYSDPGGEDTDAVFYDLEDDDDNVASVSVLRVALDFLDGRREHCRRHPYGHGRFPGGHETKAYRSIKGNVLKVRCLSKKVC